MKAMQFARADEGQALVIVAIALVALMGALALTLDWGYGYVQRRGMQNAVDNATLAAGRHVASTFKLVSGAPAFDATLEEVCADVATRTASLGGVTAISFFADPADAGTWTTITTASCATGAGVAVPGDTTFVRVRSAGTFRSITQQTIAVAASARARLTGAAGCDNIDCTALRPLELPSAEVPGHGISGHTTGPNAAMWPLALHLDLSRFQGTPCGQFCDASNPANHIPLWPANGYGPAGQRFTGLLTYTHFSPREDGASHQSGQVHQLSTESDYTGTTNLGIRQAHVHDDGATYPLAQMPDLGSCSGNTWDTLGMEDLADAATCDLPNWFAYGFRGSVGLGTDWHHASWAGFESAPGFADLPDPMSTDVADRASCSRSIYLARPSCRREPSNPNDSTLGDWIETVPGDMTTLMANRMRTFVATYGRVVPHSSTPVSALPGAPLLGRAAVVWIPLWDCAEHFNELADQGAPGRWTLLTPAGGDCSQLVSSATTVDRVHIAAIVPITVYEGLIETSPINVRGVWGNVFGDAGICSEDPLAAGCDLNQIMNSAFLVPDE
jgi:Flp pilus assembly protein TadG